MSLVERMTFLELTQSSDLLCMLSALVLNELSCGCSWRLIEAANGITNALPQSSSLLEGKNFVDWLFDYAVAHKLKVVRMFGFGDVQDGEGAALESPSGELFVRFPCWLTQLPGAEGHKVCRAKVSDLARGPGHSFS